MSGKLKTTDARRALFPDNERPGRATNTPKEPKSVVNTRLTLPSHKNDDVPSARTVKLADKNPISMLSSMPDHPSQSVNKSSNAMPRNHNGNELDVVTQRVEKTKKEIAQLTAQLQQLISDGIKQTPPAPDPTPLPNDHEASPLIRTPLSPETIADAIRINLRSPEKTYSLHCENYSIPCLRQERVAAKESPKEEPCKRVRHYDRDAAREYIRKQKEKRKELLMLKKKESKASEDLRRQKLRELREKALKLISKGCKEKSVKVSTDAIERASFPSNHVENGANCPTKMAGIRQALLQNVTFTRPGIADADDIPELTIPAARTNAADNGARIIQAAIKIQAIVRGHLARKRFKRTLALQRRLRDRDAKNKKTEPACVEPLKGAVPVWLQTPNALPYPYNFLSAVKQKLNTAVQNMAATATSVNCGAQTSFAATANQCDSNNDSTSKRSDLKSFLSRKCLDLDMEAIEKLTVGNNNRLNGDNESVHSHLPHSARNCDNNNSDSDTSNNIPDISSEQTAPSERRSPLKSVEPILASSNNYSLNTEKIKELRLHKSGRQSVSDRNSSNRNSVDKSNIYTSEYYSNSSGRDSIISYNKCDYSKSISNGTNNASTKGSTRNTISNELRTEVMSPSHEETRKSIAHEEHSVKTKKWDTLTSFQDYMNRYNDTPVAVEMQEEIPTSEISLQIHTEPTHQTQSLEKQSSDKVITETIVTNSLISRELITPNALPNTNGLSSQQDDVVGNSSSTPSDHYSNNFTSIISTRESPPSLQPPNVALEPNAFKIKPGKNNRLQGSVVTNEIQLKFEAELHLINDVRESSKQAAALGNPMDNIKMSGSRTILQHQDTQTSLKSLDHSDSMNSKRAKTALSNCINFSRGCEIDDVETPARADASQQTACTEDLQLEGFDQSNSDVTLNLMLDSEKTTNNSDDVNFNSGDLESLIPTGLELSNLQDTTVSTQRSIVDIPFSVRSAYNIQAGLSLEMFEQLIKDEDARIDNLKAILKIREKALVDRTKGELAWLEIQKKYLRDTGKVREISAIKKKQRGLLIKLEHERHEMQRLKQMQKVASRERKSALKEQRNMIKAQLSTASVNTKIKRSSREEKRHSGPFKVYSIKSHSESVKSEAAFSRRSSASEGIVSVVSHSQSVVSHITEEYSTSDVDNLKRHPPAQKVVQTESVKRSLLMREAALQKRRRTAEELLQWHQRLVAEEEKVAQLEIAANAIVNQNNMEPIATHSNDDQCNLNVMLRTMTGNQQKKLVDGDTHSMSLVSIERLDDGVKSVGNESNDDIKSIESAKTSSSNSRSLTSSSISTEINVNNKETKTTSSCSNVESRANVATQLEITENGVDVEDVEYSTDVEEETTQHSTKSVEENANVNGNASLVEQEEHILVESIEAEKTVDVNEGIASVSISISTDGSKSKETTQLTESSQSICNGIEDAAHLNGDASDIMHITSISPKCSSSIRSAPSSVQNASVHIFSPKRSSSIKSAHSSSSVRNESVHLVPLFVVDADMTNGVGATIVESASKDKGGTNSLRTDETEERDETSFVWGANLTAKDSSSDSLTSEDISSHILEEEAEAEEKVQERSDLAGTDVIDEVEEVCEGDVENSENVAAINTNGTEIIVAEDASKTSQPSANTASYQGNATNDVNEEELIESEVHENRLNEISTEIGESLSENTDPISAPDEENRNKSEDIVFPGTSSKINDENVIDVKRRVSEILADANLGRENKSPRVQDIYVTAYDVLSPEHSTDSSFDDNEPKRKPKPQVYPNREVQELLKKQLEIEQEIKQLEQQQKQQLSYLFMREIPNKPPPPYTPPTPTTTIITNTSILPNTERDIELIVPDIARILHRAFLNNYLNENTTLIEEDKADIRSKYAVENVCVEFLFDLSKEAALEHYQPFFKRTGPTWLYMTRQEKLSVPRPFAERELANHLIEKIKQWLAYERIDGRETSKWSGKKRDHVDEILVVVSQSEEIAWTNFDKDELFVKNQLTRDILSMLLSETAHVLNGIFTKKKQIEC